MEVQDFTIPKGQADIQIRSSGPRPVPVRPAPSPPEEMGILDWILYGLRAFLLWLVQLIDAALAA